MLPTFGKLNLIAILPKKKYCFNDVVVFSGHDKKEYSHRIIFINSDCFSTKGDNLTQQYYEKDLPLKNIHGVVKLILKI